MTEPELIQKRLISGKGVLKVPTDVVKNRYTVLYATVVRKPKNSYSNFAYNPVRSRYGTLVFLRQGYVVDVKAIDYEKSAFDGVNDISGQVLNAVKCAYEGILQTYANLGTALGLTVTTIEDTIKDYTNLRLAWDECRLVCYADTAIELQLWRQKYDICDPDKDQDQPPPPPDDPPEPVEPGTPIEEISDPYDPDTDDDNNTEPYPGDGPPPPEPTTGTWTIVYANNGVPVVTHTYRGNPGDSFEINSPAVEGYCDLAFGTKVVRNGTDVIEPVFNCNVDGFSSTIYSTSFAPD